MYQISKYQIKIDHSGKKPIGYVINTETGEVADGPVLDTYVDVLAAKEKEKAIIKPEPTTEAQLKKEIATLKERIKFFEENAYLKKSQW